MTSERRLTRFRIGEHVILPEGRFTVLAALEDDPPYRLPVLVPCTRRVRIPGRLGSLAMGGSCSGHEDCRADWYRRAEEGRRNLEARGKPVRPKSRVRPLRPEWGDTPTA